MKINYTVLDPAKNITVIVRTPVKKTDRRFVADQIMKLEKEAEQVGFLEDNVLAMTGGEFCGNATRCAGFLTGFDTIICSGEAIKCEGTAAYIPKTLGGIKHIIFTEEMPREKAEEKIRESESATGYMFWDEKACFLKPLVYVPEADTLYWENSCASGTAMLGKYLAETYGKEIDMDINEPGGVIHITTSPDDPYVKLDGDITILKEGEICIPELNC